MKTLPEKLRIKASMIQLGERIAWGSEAELMEQAADEIERLASELRIANMHISAREWGVAIAKRAANPFHGMYQDAEGKIPVTKAGDPVGLVVNRLPPFIKDETLQSERDKRAIAEWLATCDGVDDFMQVWPEGTKE